MLLNVDYSQEPLYTVPPPNPRARHGGLPMRAKPLAQPLTEHTQGALDPRPYRIMQNIRSISCCIHNNAAVDMDGKLWTWGVDAATLDEIPDAFNPPAPNYIPQKRADHVRMVSAGATHTVYITEANELWGWGRNDYGQLTEKGKPTQSSPVHIMDGVCYACANDGATFVIREDHSLWGWGANPKLYSSDWLIPKSADRVFEPVWIMDDVAQVSAGSSHVLAIKTDGTLWGWGDYITDTVIPAPALLITDMYFSSVSVPPNHRFCMAVAKNGDLFSFGFSLPGSMVKYHDWIKRGKFSPVKVLEGVEKTVCGDYFSLILLQDGRLFSSGENGCGECGTGYSTAAFYKPKLSMPDAKDAGAGLAHGIGLQSNGDLWVWGGDYGLPPLKNQEC